jgi:hypothetical protein
LIRPAADWFRVLTHRSQRAVVLENNLERVNLLKLQNLRGFAPVRRADIGSRTSCCWRRFAPDTVPWCLGS